jgi:protocatechuate 3,4-dioxygenase beta subunit
MFFRISIGLLLVCTLFAQVETSTSIRGLVTDATGASVVGASVTIKNKATNEARSATTNDTGFYAFPSVVPGAYDIEVSHPGFKREQIKDRVPR